MTYLDYYCYGNWDQQKILQISSLSETFWIYSCFERLFSCLIFSFRSALTQYRFQKVICSAYVRLKKYLLCFILFPNLGITRRESGRILTNTRPTPSLLILLCLACFILRPAMGRLRALVVLGRI